MLENKVLKLVLQVTHAILLKKILNRFLIQGFVIDLWRDDAHLDSFCQQSRVQRRTNLPQQAVYNHDSSSVQQIRWRLD